MLVVIKKCKFFASKTSFIKFIIKLSYISIVTALSHITCQILPYSANL